MTIPTFSLLPVWSRFGKLTSNGIPPLSTLEVPMNPVVYFEMPANDRRRMAEFYTRVFGWRTQQLGPEMGVIPKWELCCSYDNRIRPKRSPEEAWRYKRRIFSKFRAIKPDQYPAIVIAVDDIGQHMKKVKDAGGELLGQPMEI